MEHVWRRVEGHTEASLVQVYAKAIAMMPDDFRFVEVGSFLGQSAAVAVVEAVNSGKTFQIDCVDLWKRTTAINNRTAFDAPKEERADESKKVDFLEKFKNNLEKHDLLQYVTPKQGKSVEIAATYEDESVDFVFIDAEHTYKYVNGDIQAWLPKLKKGGIMAGHDYNPRASWSVDGVIKAVNDNFGEGNFDLIGKCWWYVNEKV